MTVPNSIFEVVLKKKRRASPHKIQKAATVADLSRLVFLRVNVGCQTTTLSCRCVWMELPFARTTQHNAALRCETNATPHDVTRQRTPTSKLQTPQLQTRKRQKQKAKQNSKRKKAKREFVFAVGLEPTTFCVLSRRHNHLDHANSWWCNRAISL